MSTLVQTVSKEELAAKVRQGAPVQIVNVLERDKDSLGLIRASIRIPLSSLPTRAAELDPSKPVITYCAGPQCPASRKAAELLADRGFDVRAYEGGLQEWTQAGLPTD